MDRDVFQALLSPSGQEVLLTALALAPVETDFLRHFTTLSRQFPSELARAALEIAILRREGASKFPFAEDLYLSRTALEQASSSEVSSYRANRFRGFERLLDLGCSIGGDTFALAAVAPTIGADLDSLRLVMAKANVKALGLDEKIRLVQVDLNSPLPFSLPAGSAIFFDPSRRTHQRRIFSVHEYHPPLNVIQDWLPVCPAVGVKISPGVRMEELRLYDAEVEFISLRGELKEAVLWFGPLKTSLRRATVLPGPHTLADSHHVGAPSALHSTSDKPKRQAIPLSEPLRFIIEPDPSIIRSGLVQQLGEQLGAAQLDPDIAYLTSNTPVDTPFARVWQVESWHRFNLKHLRTQLRQLGVGKVVVKKRGSPLQPESLIHSLRLKTGTETNPAERILFLTHLRGQPIVVICYP